MGNELIDPTFAPEVMEVGDDLNTYLSGISEDWRIYLNQGTNDETLKQAT